MLTGSTELWAFTLGWTDELSAPLAWADSESPGTPEMAVLPETLPGKGAVTGGLVIVN